MGKICGKCNKYKPLEEFYIRKTGPRIGEVYERCKLCMKLRGRSYYYLTRERQLQLVKARVKRYKLERLLFLAQVKDKPCVDCGKRYPPWVMDFDHREKGNKLGDVSHYFLNRSWNIEKVKQEIQKCDIICSNCHRLRTYNRINNNYLDALLIAENGGYNFNWKNEP